MTKPEASALRLAGISMLALSEEPPWLRLPDGRVRLLAPKSTLKPVYVGVEDLSVR